MQELTLLDSPKIKSVHFIGIGGASMSGLAEILISLNYKVSGSDLKSSNATLKLEKLGVEIFYDHSEANIKNPDLVVYTVAVKLDNPEIIRAKQLEIPIIDRAELLGQIMKKYPYTITISGTHGKTTTTSMISMIMLEAGNDPTIHIGGQLDIIGGNTLIGGNKYFIAEACEYYESFLKFRPYLAVILNIEADHVDYFKDIEHIKASFLKFARLVPKAGYIVACLDDKNTAELVEKLECNILTYGISSKDAMWRAENIVYNQSGFAEFTLFHNNENLGRITLSVPGIHNVNNALAAIASCSNFGCNLEDIKAGLLKFNGTNKRFELKGIVNDVKVIDDYAHHPSEVKATLKAAKNLKCKKTWCVFQPHTYTRAKAFLDDFASAFIDADTVIVADIYAAREKDTGEIHSRTVAEKIASTGKEAIYISSFEDIASYLKGKALPGDMIITMGAGDIVKVGEIFLANNKA